ncbi:MAG: N,N-dimethylformamidase small subunit [Gaiellaceae bacterium]|jgi:hypothetical protein|nr:N,N-dimethylformamidase small subunit [Gaiellaceae bacterium]
MGPVVTAGGLRDPSAYPDRERAWREVYEARRVAYLAALLTDALIAEHAANPLGLGPGFYSPALQRVVDGFRTQPIRARYEFIDAGGVFDLVAVEPGRAPVVVPGARYATFPEAVHGLFLRRVAEVRDRVAEHHDG